MNKAQLVEHVAKRAKLSKRAARDALEAAITAVVDCIARGERVSMTGFGTFMARPRRGSRRINPQTRQHIMVPSKVVPAFKAGKALKQRVARGLVVQDVGGRLQVKKK